MASVLYVANTTPQAVLANGTIDLGTVIRRTANSQANLSGDSIVLTGTGYFSVTVSATFNAATTGSVIISLYKDGVPVQGALATETIGTADTEIRSISFTAVVRNACCCDAVSNLTLVNTGIAANITNIAVKVKRDA